jgi:hypothetical protein
MFGSTRTPSQLFIRTELATWKSRVANAASYRDKYVQENTEKIAGLKAQIQALQGTVRLLQEAQGATVEHAV